MKDILALAKRLRDAAETLENLIGANGVAEDPEQKVNLILESIEEKKRAYHKKPKTHKKTHWTQTPEGKKYFARRARQRRAEARAQKAEG